MRKKVSKIIIFLILIVVFCSNNVVFGEDYSNEFRHIQMNARGGDNDGNGTPDEDETWILGVVTKVFSSQIGTDGIIEYLKDLGNYTENYLYKEIVLDVKLRLLPRGEWSNFSSNRFAGW